MEPMKVQGRKSPYPLDDPSTIVFDCPRCGRRWGTSVPGVTACMCGPVDVLAFEGWKAPSDKSEVK